MTLPTFIRAKGPKPDLPSPSPGIDEGYINFPRAFLYQSVQEVPGHGGDVSVLSNTYYPPFTPLDQNPAYQEINKQIGANLTLNMVLPSDYAAKFNTITAGGDLPDLMWLITAGVPPQFFQSQCADLTPYLSGEAISDYPNLANIPTLSWKSAVVAGGIYGVPAPRTVCPTLMYVNQTRWDKEIGNELPKNADDFRRMLQQLTNADQDRWGIASSVGQAYSASESWLPAMFGTPNNWRLDASGKLTSYRETDEFKDSMAYLRDLVTSGVFHPNTLTYTSIAAKADLVNGKFAMIEQPAGTSYPDYWRDGLRRNPKVKIRALRPFRFDGNGPVAQWLAPGVQGTNAPGGVTVLKKASTERIKELLGILNYMAAPFGSKEALLMDYGVEDADFTWDANGNPVYVPQKGTTDTLNMSLSTVMKHGWVLYAPDLPDYATTAQADEQAIIPTAITDPALGYSTTQTGKIAVLNQAFFDGLLEIVGGRQDMSGFDQLVRAWRDNGGDQIRHEYEQSIAASK